jgi:hypothetical protein
MSCDLASGVAPHLEHLGSEEAVRTIETRALKGDPRAVNALMALIRTTRLAGEAPEVAEAGA